MIFGGWSGSYLGDTWEWDGVDWTQMNPQHSPSPRAHFAPCWDSFRKRAVGFGGDPYTADTWEWDGQDWLQRQATLPAGARHGHAMSFDSQARHVILFGGHDQSGINLDDSWSYAATHPASITPYGQGCAGSAGVPVLQVAPGSAPWTGDLLQLELTSIPNSPLNVAFGLLGFNRTFWSGVPLPLDLSILGMPGCSAYLEPAPASFLLGASGNRVGKPRPRGLSVCCDPESEVPGLATRLCAARRIVVHG